MFLSLRSIVSVHYHAPASIYKAVPEHSQPLDPFSAWLRVQALALSLTTVEFY
jgi:hypothetical protein